MLVEPIVLAASSGATSAALVATCRPGPRARVQERARASGSADSRELEATCRRRKNRRAKTEKKRRVNQLFLFYDIALDLGPEKKNQVLLAMLYNLTVELPLSLYTALSPPPCPASLLLSGINSDEEVEESPLVLFFLFSVAAPSSPPPAPTSGRSKTGPADATAQIKTSSGSLEKFVAVTPKRAVRAAPAASPVIVLRFFERGEG